MTRKCVMMIVTQNGVVHMICKIDNECLHLPFEL